MDILHLGFLSQRNCRRLEDHLCDPFFHSWGNLSLDRFSKGYGGLKSFLSDSRRLRGLVDLHIITECLLFREKTPGWLGHWLKEYVELREHLPEVGWNQVRSGAWQAVPVVLFLDQPYLRYFIVGLIPDRMDLPIMPAWANDVLDETSIRAVSNAASASKNISTIPGGFSLYCYPLIAGNGGLQIEGASLGLSLALGFHRVLSGEGMAQGILATGAVDENGFVSEAGHLQQKVNYAGRRLFKVLLYPLRNSAPVVPEGMDAIPVSSLEDARMFSTLYRQGSSRELNLLAGMLEDPLKFVNNCDGVPGQWVRWAHENGKTSLVLNKIGDSAELFDTIIRKFEKCLNHRPLEKADTLSKLFPPEGLRGMAETAPMAVFRWFTLNIALANHQGNVSGALSWADHAQTLLDRVRNYDPNECATYHNHKFITRHNRYHFEPGLPDELKATLRHLKKRYELSLENGYTGDIPLGCLYGSIAQNYGFCGPRLLAETEEYSLLARQAFGNETLPEYREDCLRQMNYLTYAALDAGWFDQAEETLIRYLYVEAWEDLWPMLSGLSAWRHALLARFLADTGDQQKGENYLSWARAQREGMAKEEHPWQLWLFNLGRIAESLGDQKAAASLYTASLDLCFSGNFGPTVHVMALLPLSGLWKLGTIGEIEMKTSGNLVRKAAENLNPEHFSLLLHERDFGKALEKILDQPGMLFPFSYR